MTGTCEKNEKADAATESAGTYMSGNGGMIEKPSDTDDPRRSSGESAGLRSVAGTPSI